jgi:hypothetical protein
MSIPVKRVAAIHDLSGFGRASLTAIIPIISAMGIQVCPIPTAIPDEPFIKRLGIRAGNTAGSWRLSS